MKRKLLIVSTFLLLLNVEAQQKQVALVPKVMIAQDEKSTGSQWQNKRVAFLGDSMTDARHSTTSYIYWEYLSELLGIKPYVYGISGNQWDGIYKQALKLNQEKGNEVDAILIFAGTNDFNHALPLGQFYSETTKETNHNGKMVMLKYRTPVINDSTFCGRINKVLSYLKTTYPRQQVIILTPIHRGFATFSEKNVQPDESYSNELGLYIDDYVNTLKQAGSNWSVPVIDLFSLSGLYPLSEPETIHFTNTKTDMLHPNAVGNYRLAKTLQYQLLTLPASFVR
jgi:lysophospholipase L1-like esterase